MPTTMAPMPTTTAIQQPSKEERITTYEAFSEIKEMVSKFNKNELNDLGNILSTIVSNVYGKYNAHKDINMVLQVIQDLRNVQLPETELQQDIEYKAFRDNVSNIMVNYSEAKFGKMSDIFEKLFNIYPLENKEEVLNDLVSLIIKYGEYITQKEMNAALLHQHKKLLGSQKQEIELYKRQKKMEMEQLKRQLSNINVDAAVAKRELEENAIPGTLGNTREKELVHNVGVPVQDYMSQILRPQDWSRALRPPSCIRDSTQLREPVPLLADGIPSSIHKYSGVGTILPKFAYTEEYDPKYY